MDITKLKTGQAAMVVAKRGGFLSNIYWKDDKETKFLAFLTPFEEVPGLPIHMYETANGWRTFVCRKAAIFEDEAQGQCALCDVFKDKANHKQIALAVELVATTDRVNGRSQITGFEILMDEYESKEGEQKTVPAIGMVSQASGNFWVPLASTVDRKGDITEYVLEVERRGKGKKAKVVYNFFDHEGREAIDAALEEYIPEEGWLTKLHNWIEEYGSATRYEEELTGTTASDDEPNENSNSAESADDTQSRFDALRASLEAKEKGSEEPDASA